MNNEAEPRLLAHAGMRNSRRRTWNGIVNRPRLSPYALDKSTWTLDRFSQPIASDWPGDQLCLLADYFPYPVNASEGDEAARTNACNFAHILTPDFGIRFAPCGYLITYRCKCMFCRTGRARGRPLESPGVTWGEECQKRTIVHDVMVASWCACPEIMSASEAPACNPNIIFQRVSLLMLP